jgi:hypothetical protein
MTPSVLENPIAPNLERSSIMKTMAKVAIGALMACGVAVATAAPADAGVRIGVGIGLPIGPAYYGPPPCYAYGGPCGYYGPRFVGGYWGGRGGYWHGRGWGGRGWGRGGWGHGGFHHH